MKDITGMIAKELAKELAKNYSLQDYITKTPEEKGKIVLQSFLNKLTKATDYEFGERTYYETRFALTQDFGFEKIEMPLEPGFSIMYCDSKKLLCSVEDLKDEVQITCASPYFDGTKSYRNYGQFMQSMINGEMSTMFSADEKGEIEKNQLPLLSTGEKIRNGQVPFELYYDLSEEETKRYYEVGSTRGCNFEEVAEMEERYNKAMYAREENKKTMIEQRIAMLPESFKSYICIADQKRKI